MAEIIGYAGSFHLAKQYALSCNATNDIITVADAASLDFVGGGDAFSIECWCRIPAAGDGEIVNKNGAERGYKLEIVNSSDARFQVIGDSSTKTATSSVSVATNKWVHLVATTDGAAAINLYVNNGTAVTDSGAAGNLANGSDLIIGNTTNTSVRDIGMVRIYDTELSTAQISDLNKGKFPDALSTEVGMELMLYEGSGTNADDTTGNDNDGTISNASWITTTYDTETSEAVGTGTGSQTAFSFDYENVEYDNLTVTVGGAARTLGNDFTLTPKGTITFGTAPASDAAVVATYRHVPMVLEAGGFTNWGFDVTCDTHDVTDFVSTGWRRFKAGLIGWSGSAERHWINPLGALMIQKRGILRFYTDEPNDLYYTSWGIINGIHPNTAVDTLLNESLDFQGTYRIGTESV